jgi:hypothetical protein
MPTSLRVELSYGATACVTAGVTARLAAEAATEHRTGLCASPRWPVCAARCRTLQRVRCESGAQQGEKT